jgi:uracil-DNA glycosylase
MSKLNSLIPEDWQTVLAEELASDRFDRLTKFVTNEYSESICFPAKKNIFRALEKCPWDDIKVVILGQDPYHGEGQAQGLSFSVPAGAKFPPSLRNIFKELSSDLVIQVPFQGDLTPWANQGVLLLNATLTVRKSAPGSHQKQGWEEFTDGIIRSVSEKKSGVVFVLWGKFAEQKTALIDSDKHLILTSSHPSPFSAHRGFLGSKPFSKSNDYLVSKGKKPIDWDLD